MGAGQGYDNGGTGGGVVNDRGTLSINNCVLHGNSNLFAGAISNGRGTIMVRGSVISDNHAIGSQNFLAEGGAIYNIGTIEISDSTLSGNSVVFGFGGAIANTGTLTLIRTDLDHNSVTGGYFGIAYGAGGAIYNFVDTSSGFKSSTLTISDCSLTNNSASTFGGAIFSGAEIYPDYGYYGFGTGNVSISGSTLSMNTADRGGGIYNSQFCFLTVSANSSIISNQASAGADLTNSGTLSIYNSVIGHFDSFGGVTNIYDIYHGAIGSMNIPAGTVTFYASNSSFAQSAADVIAQVVAPMVPVYDDNGDPIGEAPEPITITLNLGQGTYQDLTLSTQDNVTLIVNGMNGSVGTVNGTTVVGNSPALVVIKGNVLINNVSFSTATDAPTILVSGGQLTLRNDIVQESTGYNDAAIKITGGTLDLGTAASPGGNTINVNGAGQLILSTGPNLVSAVGNTFQVDGSTVSPVTTTGLVSSAALSLLNQPVTFTANVSVPSPGSTVPTGNMTFVDTTTGSILGVVPLSGTTAQIPVSSLPVNAQTIVAVYSGDANYITSYAILVQNVRYGFGGFLAPLNSNLTFGLNRTVPIKFQLTDYIGNYISSLSAVTSLQVLNAQGVNVFIDAGSTALRYDLTAKQFIANWNTKGLLAGSYTVALMLADGTTYIKSVQLSKNGSSAGLVTVGTDAGTTAIGALLGGDIDLYVDNSNGDLTADELARIQDAVTAVDAVTLPYGVAVMEVTDPTVADVTLNMDITSAVGGYSDGVLGCTTDAGQITIIAGWNFYAGSDATQIGTAQYDFQTVVTHELGHALGLGHNSNSTSVMFATLNAGTANRVLTTADLNVPDTGTGGACGLHATPISPEAIGFGFVPESDFVASTKSLETPQNSASSDARQAGLNAVLADWRSASDFSTQAAFLLNDGQVLSNRPWKPTFDAQDEFWSSIVGGTVFDQLPKLSGHLGV
jgi:hypothetical protein